MRRWGECIWLTGSSGLHWNSPQGFKHQFHQGFWPDQNSGNPIINWHSKLYTPKYYTPSNCAILTMVLACHHFFFSHSLYMFTIKYLKISSTRVQHKVRSRDEMRWSPYIIRPWVARVRPTTPDAPSHGLMKWNEMDEMSVEKLWNEICGRGKREKPREKPTQTPFRPQRNPHGGTETRTRDPSCGRRAANRLRHEAAYNIFMKGN